MDVVVFGGRDITVRALVFRVLDHVTQHPLFAMTRLISGKAPGVDELAEQWARARGIPVLEFKADWAAHGRAAGPLRNREMGKIAESGIGIWDGRSPGTWDMMEVLRRARKFHYVYIAQPWEYR